MTGKEQDHTLLAKLRPMTTMYARNLNPILETVIEAVVPSLLRNVPTQNQEKEIIMKWTGKSKFQGVVLRENVFIKTMHPLEMPIVKMRRMTWTHRSKTVPR